MRSIQRSMAFTVLIFGIGCRDSTDPTTPVLCSEPVTVSIGSGSQPEVRWVPACAVTSIRVTPAGGVLIGLPVWEAFAPSGLVPPIRVGGSPRGAFVWGSGVSLQLGESYHLYVSRGGRNDPDAGVDSLTFTARP